jgi:hypothetical protein
VIALSVKLDDPVLQEMTPNHWAFADARFDMPMHWREWLGTIRTEEVEQSNLFLFSKMLSQVPEIVDAETAELSGTRGTFMPGFCSQAHLRRHTSRSCLQDTANMARSASARRMTTTLPSQASSGTIRP